MMEPGFYDGEEGPFYCPHAAALEGVMKYLPEIETEIDVRRIGFEWPRKEIIELLGEKNQSTPVLVLSENTEIPPEAQVSDEAGRAFIHDEFVIGKFLSRDLDLMPPH